MTAQWKAQWKACLPQWKACLLTSLTTVATTWPLIAFVGDLSSKSAADFKACNEGCLFVRFFRSSSLPSTQVWNLDPSENSTDPAYVFVKNGDGLTYISYLESRSTATGFAAYCSALGYGLAGYFLTLHPMSFLQAAIWGRQTYIFPAMRGSLDGKAADVREVCESEDARRRVHNHLSDKEGSSWKVYVCGLVLWCLLKIVHDVALLRSSCPEACTLAIGFASWVFQFVAATAGLVWSTSALGVFVADFDGAACYYQLPDLECLLALGLPAGLFYTTISKLEGIMRSIQFGDYLYAVQYDVPHRVVQATLGDNDATGPLLVASVAATHPDLKLSKAEGHKLDKTYFRALVSCLWLAKWCWLLTQLVVTYPFVIAPLFVKLVAFFSEHKCGAGIFGWMKLLIVAILGLACFALLVSMIKKLWKSITTSCEGPRHLKQILRDTGYVTYVTLELSMLVSTLWTLAPMLRLSQRQLLGEAWLCAACGFNLAFLLMHRGYNALIGEAWNILRLRLKYEDNKKFSDREVEMIKDHPEWNLRAPKAPDTQEDEQWPCQGGTYWPVPTA